MRQGLYRFTILLLTVLAVCGPGSPQVIHEGATVHNRDQDLANLLAHMACSAHTPIIAELVQPLPRFPTTDLPEITPAGLNRLVEETPGYEWKMEGKVLHFYNKTIRGASFNFLNIPFPRFTIPPNLSELKLSLPGRAFGLLNGFVSEGGATSGFGSTELEKHKLKQTTLENAPPLQVLLYAANESPSFFSITVFSTAAPSKDDVLQHTGWFWGSLDAKIAPIYVQPVTTGSHVD